MRSHCSEPVAVTDLTRETRFDPPQALLELEEPQRRQRRDPAGHEQAWGVFGVRSVQSRRFSDADIDFRAPWPMSSARRSRSASSRRRHGRFVPRPPSSASGWARSSMLLRSRSSRSISSVRTDRLERGRRGHLRLVERRGARDDPADHSRACLEEFEQLIRRGSRPRRADSRPRDRALPPRRNDHPLPGLDGAASRRRRRGGRRDRHRLGPEPEQARRRGTS